LEYDNGSAVPRAALEQRILATAGVANFFIGKTQHGVDVSVVTDGSSDLQRLRAELTDVLRRHGGPDSDVVVQEIMTDLSRLPAPVARTRERILAAARSGELSRLVAVMTSGETLPIFSQSTGQDPITYWRTNFPDSDGLEILATLIDILDTGFVRVDEDTPQEMYVWPYFARVPLRTLTTAQKVDLFKIVTGSDYKDMLGAGSYNFFRVGIGRDGSWRFFVTGN
jgi:hypothetical protein